MAEMYRVNTVATGLSGGQLLSTHFFDASGGTAAQAKNAVNNFWIALRPVIASTVQMTVQGEVFQVEATTGDVVGVTTNASNTNSGTASGSPLPPANQGLLRNFTGAYVGGRQIRGRTYIWGTTDTAKIDGGTTAAYRTATQDAGNALIADATSIWVVWSRKNGVFAPVNGVSTWAEFGVQRSRRD